MASWVIGDVHGCAEELALLLERLSPGPEDAVLCVGDLFHRGPDPAGVMDLLSGVGARFVLGNHEHRVLQRFRLAPERADAADRPARRDDLPPLEERDLDGDGGRPCDVAPERRADVVRFLQGHSGYRLRGDALPGGGSTPDGRPWWVVHAGVDPERGVEGSGVGALTRARRTRESGAPFWYERWAGPELVLFGHTPGRIPRPRRHGGRLVALGLDTGCVYGGSLTAYCPERDELASVPARTAWVQRA